MENANTEILEGYFGDYSPTTKAYRTQGGPDLLFREIATFLLDIKFLHPNPYPMPKNL